MLTSVWVPESPMVYSRLVPVESEAVNDLAPVTTVEPLNCRHLCAAASGPETCPSQEGRMLGTLVGPTSQSPYRHSKFMKLCSTPYSYLIVTYRRASHQLLFYLVYCENEAASLEASMLRQCNMPCVRTVAMETTRCYDNARFSYSCNSWPIYK
ncbi:hypothetical protein NQ317_001874 [Molorchus minor]|uniref:Uncharacterized protein n=1 Tax=Molorchus minor TaxID=1323400 RepID=A0ABQ9J580_9CUCU|nr:hypothetical protein NQ317_001874 [Molorchus minor]